MRPGQTLVAKHDRKLVASITRVALDQFFKSYRQSVDPFIVQRILCDPALYFTGI